MIYKVNKISSLRIIYIAIIISILAFTYNVSYARISTNLPISEIKDEFPESYKPYIDALKASHPNWVFKAVYTNLDWNLVITHETYETNKGISTIPGTYPDSWKYKENGNDVKIDGPFVTASKSAVMYTVDPRNYLTEQKLFAFETLSFSNNTSSIEAVDKVIQSTPMSSNSQYGRKYKNNNEWLDMSKSYAEMIYEAGKTNNISPIHIASRMKQETACDIVNNLSINGSFEGLTGLYNYFNIGATPDSNGNNALKNGLLTAKSKGWTYPEKSILEGSATLANNYIKWGQNTIYFQKFDVNNPGQAAFLFGSQYMTNILAPQSESTIMYNAYNKADMLGLKFEFHIPVYNNMPLSACPEPSNNSGGEEQYVEDNTKVYLDDGASNGTDVFNIRSTPDDSTSSNIINVIRETKEGQENRTVLLRILKGNLTGWDKVRLPNGIEGYVASRYVNEYLYTKVTDISLSKYDMNLVLGQNSKIEVTVAPTNATFKDVNFASSDSAIASVDGQGNIKGLKVGRAIITVTSVDQSKTATCTVNVLSDSQSISFPNSKYTIFEGSIISIVPNISSNIDAQYELSIEDTTVAAIVDANIKGIKAGTTKLIATIKGTNIKAETEINVIKSSSDNQIIINDKFLLKDNVISKVNVGTKISEIKSNITTKLNIRTVNNKNEDLTDEDIAGTGSKIIFSNESDVHIEYTIVIFGDVNGDGKINSADLLGLRLHLLEKEVLDNSYFKAGNISREDTKINSLDLLLLREHLIDKSLIVQ